LTEQGMVEAAIALATELHRGQVDKARSPYILHPLRVMLRMQTPEGMAAAVLHDTIEDCGMTEAGLLARGFPESVAGAVAALTRREGEDYLDFIRRLAPKPLARAVKLADLEDNLTVSRLPEVTEHDAPCLNRYLEARRILSQGGDEPQR